MTASAVTDACQRWEQAVIAAGRGDALELLDDEGLSESQVRRRMNRAGLRCPADVAAWFGWRNGLRRDVERRGGVAPLPPSSYLPIPLEEAIARCDDPMGLGKDVQEATGYYLAPGHLVIAMGWSTQFIVAVLDNSPRDRLRAVDFELDFGPFRPRLAGEPPPEHYSFVDLMDGMAGSDSPHTPRCGVKKPTHLVPKGLRGVWWI